jgi:hypothetical protein
MKHAIRHVHFVAFANPQPKPGLCGAVPAHAVKYAGGLTA